MTRLTAKQRIARLRAQQQAPIAADAPIEFHICWGFNEAAGEANPPPAELPEGLAALLKYISEHPEVIRELIRKKQEERGKQ